MSAGHTHKRNGEILLELKVEPADENLRGYKSSWLLYVTRTNSNWMAKVMLNYGPNGGRRLGRPLKRLIEEAETGLLRPDCWLMIMMMVMITKMLLIRTAANAEGGFKFVASLNIFTTVQCTESAVEGFNRVTQISSTHFLIFSDVHRFYFWKSPYA